jgi:uncharacterized protein (TIGR02145 family)
MKYIRVRIVIGTSSGVFDIYHDEIDINKRALLQSNGQPAIGITFDELSDLNGILVSVPDESESIIVTSDPDSFCSENGGVNNDSYTIPIGCYTYAVTSKFGVSTYTYTDCECNEIVASIDGSNGQIQQTFCALYGTVNGGDLELTFIQGCETTSIELCYDENLPELACECDPTPTPTPTQIVDPCVDCVANDVTIGSQIWTGCNLDVTTYRDGTPIPQVTDPNEWANLTTGAWCYYENQTSNGTTYGKLYNIYAILDTAHGGLAPIGYRVPSNDDWTTLTATLGGGTWIDTWGTGSSFYQLEIGGYLKEAGSCHWFGGLSVGSNTSGFTALPAGNRATAGYFGELQGATILASSSRTNNTPGLEQIWGYSLTNISNVIDKGWVSPTQGISVRLIKD